LEKEPEKPYLKDFLFLYFISMKMKLFTLHA